MQNLDSDENIQGCLRVNTPINLVEKQIKETTNKVLYYLKNLEC